MPVQTAADIDTRHKGWHAWQSDGGHWWATSTVSPFGGSGRTEDADTLDELDALLAKAGEAR